MIQRIAPPFEGQQFTSHQEWVNKARSWLTCHPQYNDTQHGETKGWRGKHFTAMCFDSFGRRVTNGGDFRRAEEEGAFPVWWVWPDQIVELVSLASNAKALAAFFDATEAFNGDEDFQIKLDRLLQVKPDAKAARDAVKEIVQ